MVSIIIWSKQAIASYGENIAQFGENDKQLAQFKNYTQATLELLQIQPQLGDTTVYKADIRKIKIIKRIVLIYRYVHESNTIELIQFHNTLQPTS